MIYIYIYIYITQSYTYINKADLKKQLLYLYNDYQIQTSDIYICLYRHISIYRQYTICEHMDGADTKKKHDIPLMY